MTFQDIPSGAAVFVDANTFLYHFTSDTKFGAACRDLLDRVAHGDLIGFTSTHLLPEIMHRLMTVEAANRFGWTQGKVALRLRQHPDAVMQLNQFRSSLARLLASPIKILDVTVNLIDQAATVSGQLGLLTNDALVIAVMQVHGLTNLASNDSDFDRVPGIVRYAPS